MNSSPLRSIDSNKVDEAVQPLPDNFASQLQEDIDAAGGGWHEAAEFEGAIGRTMFDTPTSKDNTSTVLLPPDQTGQLPSQSLVRIKSLPSGKGGDGRQYLGAVVQ